MSNQVLLLTPQRTYVVHVAAMAGHDRAFSSVAILGVHYHLLNDRLSEV